MMVPFGEISPISFFLSFIEMSVEVNDISLDKIFPQLARLHFLSSVAPLELPILLFSDVSSDLGRHLAPLLSI